MIQLPPEFSRLLQSLNSNGAKYLIVGGYAVNLHGYVRTTGDLDVWIDSTPENAEKVVAAVKQIGFNPPVLKPQNLLRKGAVLRIGTPPLQFDIINDIDGVLFDRCYQSRLEIAINNLLVPFISLEDLKTNKKASGRNKDIADLDYLP